MVHLIFGWLYFFTIDYLNYSDFNEQFKGTLLILVPRNGKYDDIIWIKLIAIGFGVISLYFAYKNKLQNQIQLRILLISFSLLLIIISIVAFPDFIVQYLI